MGLYGRVAGWVAGGLLALASLMSLGGGAAAADRVVRIFNWSDYIDETILADFTKETGIKVVYDVFDSNEILETKLLAGGSGYDVVVPTGPFLSRQIKAGVFRKLDKSKLPNISNMWPDIQTRSGIYDPGNEYSINYMWGTTGIGYNVEKVKALLPDAPVDSWRLVLDPEIAEKLKPCGITFLDAPDDILPAVLNYLGLDPNSSKPEDLEKATAHMMKLRPFIRKFHSSEYINNLANGDICVAVGYSGDLLRARDRAEQAKNGVVINYNLPKEGAQMWFDQMAIPADAKNVEEAHAFLNFMMRPEIIARASNHTNYANGNLTAKMLVDEGIRTNTSIYPDDATLGRLFVKTAYDQKTQRLVTRSWTKVVTGK